MVSQILAEFVVVTAVALNMATNFSFPNLEFSNIILPSVRSLVIALVLALASKFQCHFSKELRICCVHFLTHFFVLCDFVKQKFVEFSSLSHSISFACSFHSFSFTNLLAKVSYFEWKFSNKILFLLLWNLSFLQNFQLRD